MSTHLWNISSCFSVTTAKWGSYNAARHTKLRLFTVCLFSEKVCGPLSRSPSWLSIYLSGFTKLGINTYHSRMLPTVGVGELPSCG